MLNSNTVITELITNGDQEGILHLLECQLKEETVLDLITKTKQHKLLPLFAYFIDWKRLPEALIVDIIEMDQEDAFKFVFRHIKEEIVYAIVERKINPLLVKKYTGITAAYVREVLEVDDVDYFCRVLEVAPEIKEMRILGHRTDHENLYRAVGCYSSKIMDYLGYDDVKVKEYTLGVLGDRQIEPLRTLIKYPVAMATITTHFNINLDCYTRKYFCELVRAGIITEAYTGLAAHYKAVKAKFREDV